MAEEVEVPGPEIGEKLREIGERAEEALKKIGSALETTAERIEKHDVPTITRNVLAAAMGGVTLYILGTAVGTMVPQAVPVFQQMAVTIGYLVPIMLNVMMVATMLGLVKMLVR